MRALMKLSRQLPGRESQRMRRPAFAGLAILSFLITGCGSHSDKSAADQDQPFASLHQCPNAPFIGVVSGLTPEGRRHSRNGDSPATDIYGIRPDGSMSAVTTDLGMYQFGITTDGATIYARADPERSSNVSPLQVPDQIIAIDTRSEKRSTIATLTGVDISTIRPSPNGDRLAVAASTASQQASGSGQRLAFLSLTPPRQLTWPPGQDPAAAHYVVSEVWSPDGQSLAYGNLTTNGYELRILSVDSGADAVLYRGPGTPFSLDWSADGKRILIEETGVDETNLHLARGRQVETQTGASKVVITGPQAELVYAALDGSRILLFASDGEGRVTAQAWARNGAGTFDLASTAPVGEALGVVSVTGPSIPKCALL